jgi:4-hydroxyisophthalate hydroxylase
VLFFPGGDGAVAAFEEAANALAVPLKIVRDNYADGRAADEAKLILVRPDRSIAWTADSQPEDAAPIAARVAGRA